MLTYTRARAQDVRALACAIALGSGAGLLVGAAYLAGGYAAKPFHPAPAEQVEGKIVATNDTGSPVPANAVTSNSVAPLASLRARFRIADNLTRVVARPFDFRRVANAPTDLNCLAEAVYFEARGEAPDGQRAVAQVVLNRVRHPAFPKTICAVVHQRTEAGCQFTFACSPRQVALDSGAWRRARDVASAALHGAVMAAVGDATHFQTAHAGPFAGLLKVAQVGAHVFYRFGGRNGSAVMFRQTPAPSVSSVRFEVARLETAPETLATERLAPEDAQKPAAAKLVGATIVATPSFETAAPVSKPVDTRLQTPFAATVIKAPPSNTIKAPALAKPALSLALAQS